MNNDCIEIFPDASLKKFNNGRIVTCAGVLFPKNNISDWKVMPDSTNNEAELMAVYMAVKMAKKVLTEHPEYENKEIRIYSDSKSAVYGLTKSMPDWLKNIDIYGKIYNNSNQLVKNQELFFMIINYLVDNNLKVKFLHIKGHINYFNNKKIDLANRVFKESNGYKLSNEDMSRICFYNCMVDEYTRKILNSLSEEDLYKYDRPILMANVIPPKNYREFIL